MDSSFTFRKTLIFVSVISFLLLSGCGSEQQEEQVSAEISYTAPAEDVSTEIKETIEAYLSAVAEQDHLNVTQYTTENFVWNYDETGFYDYSRDISGFSVEKVDTAHIVQNGDEYIVPVTYTLSYEFPYVDEDGVSQYEGDYMYDVNFIIKDDGETYRIDAVSDRPKG